MQQVLWENSITRQTTYDNSRGTCLLLIYLDYDSDSDVTFIFMNRELSNFTTCSYKLN